MKSYFFIISFFLFLFLSCQKPTAKAAGLSDNNDYEDTYSEYNEGNSDNDGNENASTKPYKIVKKNVKDSVNVVSLLNEKVPDDNLVIFYAKKFLGKPYVVYTLDKEKEECLVINTQELDCTTFVENVLTLAWCKKHGKTSFGDFCDALVKMRYIGEKVAYTSRQHYFTIWMDDNVKEKLLSHVSLPPAPLSAKRKPNVNYMTNNVSQYQMLKNHPQWIGEIDKMEKRVNEIELTYIPKQQLAKSDKYRKYVKDGDVIAIVTNKRGLDISHVGFAIWHKDGLHLMHASSLKKKVVDDDVTLYQYLQKQSSAVGISLLRML